MWVVFCNQTGEEQDTFDFEAGANEYADSMEALDTWGYSYSVRFEQD